MQKNKSKKRVDMSAKRPCCLCGINIGEPSGFFMFVKGRCKPLCPGCAIGKDQVGLIFENKVENRIYKYKIPF